MTNSFYTSYFSKYFNTNNHNLTASIQNLDSLFSRYVLLSFIDEMDEKQINKINSQNFNDVEQLIFFLKSTIEDFDGKFNLLEEEFVNKYVRKNSA